MPRTRRSTALTAFVRYATEHRRLVQGHIDEEAAEAALRRAPSLAFYAVAIGVGFLLPTVGVGLYLVIALYPGVPARTVHRLLRRG